MLAGLWLVSFANAQTCFDPGFEDLMHTLGPVDDRVQMRLRPESPQFEAGTSVKIEIDSAVDGRLIVLVRDAEGAVAQLFPQPNTPNDRIEAGKTFELPTKEMAAVRVTPPLGQFFVFAIVRPIDGEGLPLDCLAEPTKSFRVPDSVFEAWPMSDVGNPEELPGWGVARLDFEVVAEGTIQGGPRGARVRRRDRK